MQQREGIDDLQEVKRSSSLVYPKARSRHRGNYLSQRSIQSAAGLEPAFPLLPLMAPHVGYFTSTTGCVAPVTGYDRTLYLLPFFPPLLLPVPPLMPFFPPFLPFLLPPLFLPLLPPFLPLLPLPQNSTSSRS